MPGAATLARLARGVRRGGRRRRLTVAAAALLAAAIPAACASESVSGVPAGAITISPTNPTVRLGETVRLTATVQGDAEGAAARQLFWSTSDAAVATVDATGLVTPVAPGTARIAASAGGASAVAEVRVLEMAVASVRLQASPTAAAVGDTLALTVVVRGAGGVELSGRAVTIRSLAPAVLEVVGERAIARQAGRASLVAESEGVADTLTIDVKPAPVKEVRVSPSSLSLEAGKTTKLTVETRDRSGQTLTGRTVTFSTSASSVATVASDGTVRGVGAGSATITATSEGVSGTVAVTVTKSTPIPPDDGTPPPPDPPGPPTKVEIVSGGIQVGAAGSYLSQDLVVRVTDAAGKPVKGVSVGWSANRGGSTEDATTSTGTDGRTSTRWRLGNGQGTQQATASVSGVGSVMFQAIAFKSGSDDDDDDDPGDDDGE